MIGVEIPNQTIFFTITVDVRYRCRVVDEVKALCTHILYLYGFYLKSLGNRTNA